MSAAAMVLPEVSGTGSAEQCRRTAVAEAVDEARAGSHHGRAVVAVRRFGDGALVVAVGGHVHDAAVQHVEAWLRGVHHLATRHLVIDLAAVLGSDRRLARVLGHARIRCLVHDVTVTVQHLPEDLRDEYGHQIGRSGPP